MAIITDREPVTITRITDDSAPASFIAATLGVIVVAVIAYMLYALNHNATTVTPDMNAPQAASAFDPASVAYTSFSSA
jgi:hypothetical protein